MAHIEQVLQFGTRVVLPRSPDREWILGNKIIASDGLALMGQIGWQQREVKQSADRFDPTAREWHDVMESAERAARAPFAIDGSSRLLGVLKHHTFSEGAVAHVFERLLREGENRQEWPTTEWSVEPILDEQDFLAWLRSVQSVQSISLVARLPNPDAMEEFGPVWVEMSQRKARLISQKLVAASEEEGLQDLEADDRVRGHIAMAREGYGYVMAQGRREGRETIYNQRDKVARETTDELPPVWVEAMQAVLEVVRRRRR